MIRDHVEETSLFFILMFSTLFGSILSLKLAHLATAFTLGRHWAVFLGLFSGSLISILVFWKTIYVNPHIRHKSHLKFLAFAWTCTLAMSPYASFQIGLLLANLFYPGIWPYEFWAIKIAIVYFSAIIMTYIVYSKIY